ncbi:hypothetical protein ECANGB1_900 [Enterospora canceri]|uniref:Uncharacterized protein n=1 Tax=Enterospora canceri TaxID=1081671 RepID=A0A1Y1S797_9MICR|nr:hypothetical protein ECANGB1_900 [Enterospora canceri]
MSPKKNISRESINEIKKFKREESSKIDDEESTERENEPETYSTTQNDSNEKAHFKEVLKGEKDEELVNSLERPKRRKSETKEEESTNYSEFVNEDSAALASLGEKAFSGTFKIANAPEHSKNIFAVEPDQESKKEKNESQFLKKNLVEDSEIKISTSRPKNGLENANCFNNIKICYYDELEMHVLAVGIAIVKNGTFAFLRPGLVRPLICFKIKNKKIEMNEETGCIEFMNAGRKFIIEKNKETDQLYEVFKKEPMNESNMS